MSLPLNVLIISASQREGSESARVSEALNSHYLDGQASILNLYEQKLPMWDGEVEANESVQAAQALTEAADALILVIPEWHGMVPAALKNLLLWCGAAQLAHKPVLLVAVSAGTGGAFVIAEMRSSGYKNSRMLYLPEHLVLRGVKDLWPDLADSSETHYLEKRTGYAIEQLKLYASTLKPVREQLVADISEYKNGMS